LFFRQYSVFVSQFTMLISANLFGTLFTFSSVYFSLLNYWNVLCVIFFMCF